MAIYITTSSEDWTEVNTSDVVPFYHAYSDTEWTAQNTYVEVTVTEEEEPEKEPDEPLQEPVELSEPISVPCEEPVRQRLMFKMLARPPPVVVSLFC